MKKKKGKKCFFNILFSKTAVNPLRKKKPYGAKKTPMGQTDLTLGNEKKVVKSN